MKGSNSVFSLRGKSGLIKITFFLMLAGLTGRARIIYLEEKFIFSGSSPSSASPSSKKTPGVSPPGSGLIYVNIEGEVKNPGLYKLKKGASLADIIKMGGGMTSAADRSAVNLSRRLEDGEKVVVPPSRGFFSRMGVGRRPDPTYMITPEEQTEIEVIRVK